MITNTTTIRLEIEKGIRQKGHSLSSFGKQAGINRGIISGILNGNPPKSISIRQLDLMAEALGHAEGWMYEYYVDECFINEKADWRRIKAFLLRCTEIGRYDCIQEVLDRLMEDLNNTISIFGLAEELYAEGKVKESLPFYECVIENEKHQHSERLAIAHYRVFRASIGDNTEKSLRAVIRFEPYRNRLPENLMLDALLQLANVYYLLQDWYLLDICADELNALIQNVYREEVIKMQNNKNYVPPNTERHLVVYYGQSYLIKSTSLEYRGKYEEAKKCIYNYQDLSWFEGLGEEGNKEINKFKVYAFANLHTLDLLMGKIDTLDDYISFMEKNPNEILPGMLVITKSSIKFNFDINDVISKFSDIIYREDLSNNVYPQNIALSRYLTLYYQLAIYYFKNKHHSLGIRAILLSLDISIKVSNKNKILDCISLFEKFKEFATKNQIEIYEFKLKEVNQDVEI